MDRQLPEEEILEKEIKSDPRRTTFRSKKRSIRKLINATIFIGFLASPSVFSLIQESELANEGLRWDESRGVAPLPEAHTDAVLQIYGARTRGAKGNLAIHTWISLKPENAEQYEVIQVIGWRQRGNGPVVFIDQIPPDRSWYGNEPFLLLDLRGAKAEVLISKVYRAQKEYPWRNEYTIYPGPNSNTFVSWIGLQIPELGLDLPSTAIGKDWRPLNGAFGRSASGSGIQLSLFGLIGFSLGIQEGMEINLFGLSFELDLFDMAIELPFFGRYGSYFVLPYLTIIIILVIIRRRNNTSGSARF